MQKVEGSSPFIRSSDSPAQAGRYCPRSSRHTVQLLLGAHRIAQMYDALAPVQYSTGADRDDVTSTSVGLVRYVPIRPDAADSCYAV